MWALIVQWLRRDWRQGEWRVLLFALLIGVGSVATTGFVSDRFNRALTERGGEFLGADMVVVSPKPLTADALIDSPPLHSEAIDFASMISFGDAFQMVSLRSVDDYYPLRGSTIISTSLNDVGTAKPAQPPRGHVYVDPQLLSLLNVQLGQRVDIGESSFVIAGLVRDEPGRAGSAVFGMAPRVFMHEDDLAATQLVQPGSRVTYQYYFAGREEDIQRFITELKPRLLSSQRIVGGREGSEALGNAFTRTERFFGLSSLVSLLLSSVAIALAARRFAQRHLDAAALVRCFGMTTANIRWLFFSQIFFVGIVGCIFGVALGVVGQHSLLRVLAPQMLVQLPDLHWQPAVAAVLGGLLTLFAASLPALWPLARVPPLRVLRREVMPLPLSIRTVIAISIAAFLALTYWYTNQWRLMLGFVIGMAGLILILWLLSRLMLKLGALLQKGVRGAWRFGLAQLLRHRVAATIQLGAFALALFLMLAAALIRTDLINAWQQQLPVDAPNHFLVNITPDQVTPVREHFARDGVDMSRMYPIIRGRLISKNDVMFADSSDEKIKEDNSLKRELNLTWDSVMPSNNQIVAGNWHGDQHDGGVSVEEKLAQRLGLAVGDVLVFRVGDQDVRAAVTSVRSVKWDSMQPNFFFIFGAGYLNDTGVSYIAAAHVDETQRPLLSSFVKSFPTITLISLDKIINDVQRLIAQVVIAIEVLLLFLLLSGLAVLLAALLSSLDERLREAVLLRTMGAQRAFLHGSLAAEFVSLGMMAGLLAAIGAEVFAYFVGDAVFELPFALHPWVWLAGPGVGAVIVSAFGWLATRRVTTVAPMTALRETG